MAINWTEARIEEVVAEVIKSLGGAPEKKVGWDSTQYNGRKLIGVFADMNDAIDAATAGYKVIRAMSLEEREKVISAIRELCRKEASVMAELGVAETKMGRVEHKTAKHPRRGQDARHGGHRRAGQDGRLRAYLDGNGALRRRGQHYPEHQPLGNGSLQQHRHDRRGKRRGIQSPPQRDRYL